MWSQKCLECYAKALKQVKPSPSITWSLNWCNESSRLNPTPPQDARHSWRSHTLNTQHTLRNAELRETVQRIRITPRTGRLHAHTDHQTGMMTRHFLHNFHMELVDTPFPVYPDLGWLSRLKNNTLEWTGSVDSDTCITRPGFKLLCRAEWNFDPSHAHFCKTMPTLNLYPESRPELLWAGVFFAKSAITSPIDFVRTCHFSSLAGQTD